MSLEFLLKLIPLYLTILLGWLAARYLEMSGRHIAGMMLYMITPSVVFNGVMHAPLTPSIIALPLVVWLVCSAVGLGYFWIGQRVLKDSRANILTLAVATGNTGYFGIPVAVLLFGEDALGLYIVCMLGTTLFENSVGFYVAARGRESPRTCLMRVLRLPSLYAFGVAVLLNLSGLSIPNPIQPWFDNIRGAYTILGMMLVGMAISSLRGLGGDWRFTGLAFSGKFLVWPAIVLAAWTMDHQFGPFYDEQIYKSLLLVSITPIAANTVMIATLLDVHPKQVAGTTLLSTFFALLYIPLMVALFLT